MLLLCPCGLFRHHCSEYAVVQGGLLWDQELPIDLLVLPLLDEVVALLSILLESGCSGTLSYITPVRLRASG